MDAVVVHEMIIFSGANFLKLNSAVHQTGEIIINFLLDCGHITNTRKDPPVGKQHLLAKPNLA